MSTIKSSAEHLTLNADGSGNDIKFQSNGTEVASISDGGVVTATSFSGSGANLTGISSVGGATGVDFNDNTKARFGTGNDLEIYHDGTHSYIKDVGTGDLRIKGTELSLRSDSQDEPYINCTENGSVAIFHNNVKKLETASGGVLIGTTDDSLMDGLKVETDSTTKTALILNSNPTSNYARVLRMQMGTDHDNNSSFFIYGSGGTGGSEVTRYVVYSDGDVYNHDNTYGSTSDERIKQDITDASSQWEDIKALKVRNFKRKDDVRKYGSDAQTQIGLIAQEAETVSPGLVKLKDPTKSDIASDSAFGRLYTSDDSETQGENPTAIVGEVKVEEQVKQMKYSVLYMKSIKALQEAMARIETLEAKVAALEA